MQDIYYKGCRMPWYIPGMDSDATVYLDPVKFTPDMLPKGRIEQGGDKSPLIRIPDIPKGLSVRKDGSIELILESRYDKETRQTRNKKVVIGHDASHLLPGMMTPNDTFFEYFKNNGKPIDPARWQKQKEEEQNQPQNNQQQEQNQLTPTNQSAQDQEQPTNPKQSPLNQPTKNTKQGQGTKRMPEDDLLKKTLDLLQKEADLNAREKLLDEWQEALERKEAKLTFKAAEEDKDHIKLLSYILERYAETIQHQANYKPNAPMSPKQIRTINEILSELRDYFTGSETDHLLHLAEEPDESTGNPGTTNGEMALLISAYQITANTYRYDELRPRKNKKTRNM